MLRNSINDTQAFIRRFVELDDNGSVWKDRVYENLVREINIKDWSVDELLSSYELCFCGFGNLKPYAFEALHDVHEKGYRLGLVSNGKSPFQERNFHALGISDLFSTVVVSEALGVRKPDPAIFTLACDNLNVSLQDVVFVGDNPVADIKGARELGMYTVFIPGAQRDSCSHADAVCADYREFSGIVEHAD